MHALEYKLTKMKRLSISILLLASLCIPAIPSFAQTRTDTQRIADLEQDMLAMKETIGRLRMDMEQLQRDNAALQKLLAASNRQNSASFVTLSQLDTQIANLRAELIRAQTTQKNEIIDEVSRQIERLAQQTQQALQAQAASAAATNTPPPEETVTFSDNYPKTGTSYTVQKGDTLSDIAKRFNSNVDDIRNANHIADPRKLQLGQRLFIPQKTQQP